MEPITEPGIDLFAEELPSMDEIGKLAEYVHSGERNEISFGEQVEANIRKTSPRTVLAVGIGLFIAGRDGEAVEKLEKAEDCKEKFIYRAFALRRMGRFDEAIEGLQKSLAHEADPLNVALEKAATYRYARDFEAAEKELKNCANFENVSAEYHYQVGRLEEMQGFYEEAMDNYKTALELSPGHQKALFHLAYRCDLSGDDETAVDYYRQIASQRAIMFGKDIESSMTMFYDEEKEKKKDRGVQILETSISEFELSVRSRNCFRKMNIETLGDLMNITEAELLSYKNFGETSLQEIKVILESKGLHLGMALEEQQVSATEDSDADAEEDADRELLNRPVDDLRLSVRARKCLERLGIHTLADLTRKTDAELLGVKNFGVTSLNEIKKALSNAGLALRSLD
ncbi:MAG: DNA-directed RNA polymerase subunit alpha C-terminal domain-containing protein [Planctomycetota bacterium]|jgi:DNA-directed RNA polymerase subunit alpha